MIYISQSIDDCLHLFRYDSEKDVEEDYRETIFRNASWEDVCLRVGLGNKFRHIDRAGRLINYISHGTSAEVVQS